MSKTRKNKQQNSPRPEENVTEPVADDQSASDDNTVATETVEEPDAAPVETKSPEELLQEQLADAKDQMLRARADFDNYRKRMAREMERVRKTAAEMLIHDLLPGIDNLDLALQHADDKSTGLAQGVEMVFKQLRDALGGHGLTPIDALGKPFDPNVHEAVSQVPSDEYEKDHVAHVFQSGYTLGDVVLRPSKVVVSTGKPDETTESTN